MDTVDAIPYKDTASGGLASQCRMKPRCNYAIDTRKMIVAGKVSKGFKNGHKQEITQKMNCWEDMTYIHPVVKKASRQQGSRWKLFQRAPLLARCCTHRMVQQESE